MDNILHGAAVLQSATVFRAARTDFRNQKRVRGYFNPRQMLIIKFSFARLKFAMVGTLYGGVLQ